MFHALSRDADTVDTVDTVAAETGPAGTVSHSVHSVTGSERGRSADATQVVQQSAVAGVDDADERAAIVEEGAGVPQSWAEGFAAVCCMPPPAGFAPARWQRIVDAAGTFLDRWADVAIACGWTDLDVFGCDPDRPDARFDCMGIVLLLDRCEVAGIDERGADLVSATGARQRYRRRPLPAGTVSLWELASRGAA